MPRIPKLQYDRRLADAEKHLATLGHSRPVMEVLSKKHKVPKHTVEGWIKAVRKRWAEEAAAEEQGGTREGRRVAIRNMLHELFAQGASRTEVVFDSDGHVVMIPDGDGGTKPLVRPNPAYGACLAAVKQLRQLDALDLPKRTHLHVTGGLGGGGHVPQQSSEEEDVFFLENGRYPTAAERAQLMPSVIVIDAGGNEHED